MPLKEDINSKLGQSKHIATAQLRNMERKLAKNPKLAEDYKAFMDEYIALNHMEPCKQTSIFECFLPHHAVQRSEALTSKVRVVFNASAPTSTGVSLNDLMYTGPNLQQDLQSIIMKWRTYQYAWTADIEKMFRQIKVNEQDQCYQKILWRDSPNQAIRIYHLSTVSYGCRSSPYLAMMTLRKLASDERHRYPAAAKVLEESFYMDDVCHGSHSIEHGQQLIMELNSLLKSGGFLLRKWSSNEPKLLKNLQVQESNDSNHFTFKTDSISKTLGLQWIPEKDVFTFTYKFG
ncbi:unnamed protein product [Plutella xylostella]|uniref:(diamondback moth) hypothetical protein n=1 Tax=Plutella xylostella TaxID=51655 RepID=A0A8S4DSD4_PLUXY|nr:unnamed protein product [Plutella xylostella]